MPGVVKLTPEAVVPNWDESHMVLTTSLSFP